jgi:hypothetical protein
MAGSAVPPDAWASGAVAGLSTASASVSPSSPSSLTGDSDPSSDSALGPRATSVSDDCGSTPSSKHLRGSISRHHSEVPNFRLRVCPDRRKPLGTFDVAGGALREHARPVKTPVGRLAATLRVGILPTLSLDDPDTLRPAQRSRQQWSARPASSPVPISAAFEILAGLDVGVDANPPATACLQSRCRYRSPGRTVARSHAAVYPTTSAIHPLPPRAPQRPRTAPAFPTTSRPSPVPAPHARRPQSGVGA